MHEPSHHELTRLTYAVIALTAALFWCLGTSHAHDHHHQYAPVADSEPASADASHDDGHDHGEHDHGAPAPAGPDTTDGTDERNTELDALLRSGDIPSVDLALEVSSAGFSTPTFEVETMTDVVLTVTNVGEQTRGIVIGNAAEHERHQSSGVTEGGYLIEVGPGETAETTLLFTSPAQLQVVSYIDGQAERDVTAILSVVARPTED